MTSVPCTVTADVPVREALDLMETHRIHYLPVESCGLVIGMLNEQSTRIALSRNPGRLTAQDIMAKDPLIFRPEESLAFVTRRMAEFHQDYAIVHTGRRSVGIFTASDALNTLSDLLTVDISSVHESPRKAA